MYEYEIEQVLKKMRAYEDTPVHYLAMVIPDGRIVAIRVKPNYWDDVMVSDEHGRLVVCGCRDVGAPPDIFPYARQLWDRYREEPLFEENDKSGGQ